MLNITLYLAFLIYDNRGRDSFLVFAIMILTRKKRTPFPTPTPHAQPNDSFCFFAMSFPSTDYVFIILATSNIGTFIAVDRPVRLPQSAVERMSGWPRQEQRRVRDEEEGWFYTG